MTLAARLNQALAASGKSSAQLAFDTDVSATAVSNWRTGKTPSMSLLHGYAAARSLGVRVEWLISGEEPMRAANERGNDIAIELLQSSGEMGRGSELRDDDLSVSKVYVSARFLDRLSCTQDARSLRLIHALGDSMEPTLSAGDIVLVDLSRKSPDVDGVYVLKAFERLFIKRVSQNIKDGSWRVASDNPQHQSTETLTMSQDIECVGRVVHAWRGKKM
jgi:phage repressor protein C with HTH and peptisase S24 domain